MIRALLAGDQAMVRGALSALLSRERECTARNYDSFRAKTGWMDCPRVADTHQRAGSGARPMRRKSIGS